jgi:hypothetical protein
MLFDMMIHEPDKCDDKPYQIVAINGICPGLSASVPRKLSALHDREPLHPAFERE